MRFRKTQDEDFKPELTPLVDVVFQLIIFFMVSTVFIEYNRQVNLELPTSAGEREQAQVDVYTIEITEEEKIFLNGVEFARDKLIDQLKGAPSPPPVVIRADKRTPYGIVIQVMDICERAGITDIKAAIQ